uniref:Uncharacterized protein n=1 Tax=Thermogemmatispora argillosa TaxID=2045280 RepID=A0A455T9D4_9CHLR|nr:hypothetical protein KTA_42490 [Thermogemmatispora argillosa]
MPGGGPIPLSELDKAQICCYHESVMLLQAADWPAFRKEAAMKHETGGVSPRRQRTAQESVPARAQAGPRPPIGGKQA